MTVQYYVFISKINNTTYLATIEKSQMQLYQQVTLIILAVFLLGFVIYASIKEYSLKEERNKKLMSVLEKLERYLDSLEKRRQ